MGEVFAGRYELIDMIGEGGMGSVWMVHDRKREQVLAAKVLRQSDAGSLLRFMREQAVRIHHPHVVTPLGWAGEDDRVLFTMPLVDGGSVSDLMRSGTGRLPARYVAELMRQLLMALDAVHAAGVVHRDVKPANLLLEATGTARPQLRLTDFGIAVPIDSPRMTTQAIVLGTPGYLAPEQQRGGDPSPAWDLYAAGIVALQLLTGQRPADQRADRSDTPPRPDGIPDLLWRIVTDLADPDPAGRPPSAKATADALQVPELAWQDQTAVTIGSRLPRDPRTSVLRQEGATAPERRSVATRVQPDQPDQPAQSHRLGSTASTAEQHGRPRRWAARKIGALLAAPVVVLAGLAVIWWPGDDNHTTEVTPGIAKLGGQCQWQDAGTQEANTKGDAMLICTAQGAEYTWQPVS